MAAVAGASPVTITVRTPSPCNSLMSAAESARGGSLSAISPASFIAVARAGGHRQHAKSLGLEFVRRRRRGVRRRLDESDDDGEGALHDPLRASRRIRRRRLGHLLGRVEGGELDQARRIGDGLARGGGANGAIDRVLAAIGARQRRQRQNMRLVEAGHRAHARHGQRVARQRAGLVGAQDIHRCGFIDRREPGRQDAPPGQRSRAERRRQREGGRQRDRDRREDRGQDERDDLVERHFEKRTHRRSAAR